MKDENEITSKESERTYSTNRKEEKRRPCIPVTSWMVTVTHIINHIFSDVSLQANTNDSKFRNIRVYWRWHV